MKCKEEWRTQEWHNVRNSLRGKWMKNPDWCVLQLRLFVGNIPTAPIEKLCVVCNYLQGHLFRTKKLPDEIYHKITRLRAECCAEYRRKRIALGVLP